MQVVGGGNYEQMQSHFAEEKHQPVHHAQKLAPAPTHDMAC
jgi:hypothetical protein